MRWKEGLMSAMLPIQPPGTDLRLGHQDRYLATPERFQSLFFLFVAVSAGNLHGFRNVLLKEIPLLIVLTPHHRRPPTVHQLRHSRTAFLQRVLALNALIPECGRHTRKQFTRETMR